MALDVKVKIELSKAVGSVGFGIPLLLEFGAEKAVAYTECYTLDDVVTAGFAATTEMYKAAEMIFMQENRPAKIAVCADKDSASIDKAIAAIAAKDWRQLILVEAETSDITAAADYIETTANKMLFVSMSTTEFATFKTSIASKKYDRTVIFVNGTKHAAAALVGETAGRTAGSFTYKFKTLKGVTAETFTDADLAALHEAGAFAYVTKAGDDITSEGISQSKTYIDQTDSIDYVIQNIEYKIQKVMNTTAKITYGNRGIALIESAVKTALQEAGVNGIIATLEDGSYDYSVSFGGRSVTTEADRASRVYKYGTFRFSLAGAIHECEVFGEIMA